MAWPLPMIAHSVTLLRSDGGGTVLVGFFGTAEFQAMFTDVTTEFMLDYVNDRTLLLSAATTRRPIAVLLPVRDAEGITCAPLATRLCAEAPHVRVITLWHPERDRASLAEVIRAGSEPCAATIAADVARCLAGLRRGEGRPPVLSADPSLDLGEKTTRGTQRSARPAPIVDEL